MSEFRIIVTPRDKRCEIPECTLEILSEYADEVDGIYQLDFWAQLIQDTGWIPRTSLDVQSEPPTSLTGRMGKKAYRIRSDMFEFETENGYSEGHGFLKLVDYE